VVNSEGKKPLERLKTRWEDNNRIDIRGTGWDGMHWIHVAEDRNPWTAHVNTIPNLRVLKNVGKLLSNRATGGFSRRARLNGVSRYAINSNYENTK
jgi:hypothetical protein